MVSQAGAVSSLTANLDALFGDRYKDVVQAMMPICDLCGKKLTDPMILKCGHIFDTFCLKELLNKRPAGMEDKVDEKESESARKHSLYENTKCRIKVSILNSNSNFLGLVEGEVSIFDNRDRVIAKIQGLYISHVAGKPFGGWYSDKIDPDSIVLHKFPEGAKFKEGTTLFDYQVKRGKTVHITLKMKPTA